MTAPLSPRPESTLRRLWAGWRREIIRGTGLFILVVGGGILIVSGVRHGTARVRERFRGLAEQLPGNLDIGSSDGPRQTGDTMRWSGAAPAGNTVFIRNTNGGITVDGSQGREVRVTGVKSWGQSDPSEVRVVEAPGPEGLTICVLWSGSESDCRAGGHYDQHSLHHSDVAVDLHVTVPSDVPLDLLTVNGEVQVTGVGAPVTMKSVNGGADIATSRGPVKAVTVNGNVKARMSALDSGEVNVVTVNGNAEVDLPASVNAKLEVKTVSGSISTDFPLSVTGEFVGRQLNGALGAGGPARVHVQAVNGSVVVNKYAGVPARPRVRARRAAPEPKAAPPAPAH